MFLTDVASFTSAIAFEPLPVTYGVNLFGKPQPPLGEFKQGDFALRIGRPVGGVDTFGSYCSIAIPGGHTFP
jgi:hypothetical protein